MDSLNPRIIHFGLSHFFPIKNLNDESKSAFESNIHKHGLQVVGKVVPNIDSLHLTCKTSDDAFFNIKIEKVGEIKTAEREPLYGLTVISGENGNPNSLYQAYLTLLDSIPDSLILSLLSIRREVTIRKLYGPVPNVHSFQYLWENILHQTKDSLKSFHGIAGGGLRLVPAPISSSFTPALEGNELLQVEFKFESFLRDPRYLFIEGVYSWPEPFHFQDIDTLKSSIKLRCDFIMEHLTDSIEAFIRSLIK